MKPPRRLTGRLRGGQAWSRRLRAKPACCASSTLEGRACVSALFYNAHDPLERYNMADTLKAQYTAFLTTGRVLYSDMGRVLASIVADTCGWHDTISGLRRRARRSRLASAPGRYQKLRNDFHRNARDNFLVELGKHGLGKRDIVRQRELLRAGRRRRRRGARAGSPATRAPGAAVELRFEMDTLVVLSNTPHPLDPATTYGPPAGRADDLRRDRRPPADDPCRLSRPENGARLRAHRAPICRETGR